jgi:ABC-type Fe3+-hydroxamate transport system substrate-binding protein
MRLRSARASAFALAVLTLGAGCGGHAHQSFPASPNRLVADDQLSADASIALGYRPVAAVGLNDTQWAPALASFLAASENLGSRSGGSANLDAVTGAHPDAIVGPASLEREGWADELRRLAPTVLYSPPRPGATWEDAFLMIADALGRGPRGRSVVSALQLRASAIRPQIAGRTIALLRVHDAQSFSTVDDYDPAAMVYEHDLGLRNAHLKPQQYGNDCSAAPAPPRACSTPQLFVAITSRIDADGVLLETEPAGSAASARFAGAPYFRAMPAVRAGRVARASTFEDVGPLGVGFLYTAVERLFGLNELHANVRGETIALTFDRMKAQLCWARTSATPLVLESGGTIAQLSGRTGCRPDRSFSAASVRLSGATVAPGPLRIDDA